MANASTTGFGFVPVMNLGNTPATSGESKYKIKTGLGIAIVQNDPISLQNSSGDEGYVQDASPATCDDGSVGGVLMAHFILRTLQTNQLGQTM